MRNALSALINLTSQFEIFRDNLCGRHARGDILMSRLLALVASDSGLGPPSDSKSLKNLSRLALMLLVNATMCAKGAEQLFKSASADTSKGGMLQMLLELLNADAVPDPKFSPPLLDKFEHIGHVLANLAQIQVIFESNLQV